LEDGVETALQRWAKTDLMGPLQTQENGRGRAGSNETGGISGFEVLTRGALKTERKRKGEKKGLTN